MPDPPSLPPYARYVCFVIFWVVLWFAEHRGTEAVCFGMIFGMWLTVALLSAITSKLKGVCRKLAPLHLLHSFELEHESVHKHVRETFHPSGHRKKSATLRGVVVATARHHGLALPSITETDSPTRVSPLVETEEVDVEGPRIIEADADRQGSDIVLSPEAPTTTEEPLYVSKQIILLLNFYFYCYSSLC